MTIADAILWLPADGSWRSRMGAADCRREMAELSREQPALIEQQFDAMDFQHGVLWEYRLTAAGIAERNRLDQPA